MSSPWPLRLSTQQIEGVLRVSKWSKYQVLLDPQEMKDLFAEISPFWIYTVSEPVTEKTAVISQEDFLSQYETYARSLKEGVLPEEGHLRRLFSSIFTSTPDILYAMKVGQEKYLVKALKPVVQLQAHQFFVSSVDGRIHPMVLGKDSVSWGIQFSYPQIYQNPKDHDFFKVVDSSDFPNTKLFTNLVKWMRRNTLPTPFVIDGKRTNAPIRLGKKCMSWINKHPQLQEKGIEISSLQGIHGH
jgi:hypothetical protein